MVDHGKLCPDDRVSSLIALVQKDQPRGLRELDILLSEFPTDARLHFLKGSLLAGREDYAAARASMRRAVDLAPNYTVARFQLGFLLLTSGEPHGAEEAWGPLHSLPKDNYLNLFVRGLCHLIRDEFDDAVRLLREGMAHNRENVPMNADMQLIVEEVERKMSGQSGEIAAVSSVDLLLQQARLKSTRH
jgi:tetratricopeptide (TPR) repeat protein